jgi:hypothetical protein
MINVRGKKLPFLMDVGQETFVIKHLVNFFFWGGGDDKDFIVELQRK